MDSQTPIIDVRDLRKTFDDHGRTVTALDGVSFTVEAGESLGIIGPSGSGKSTLLHLLGGLDTPTSGAVTVDGHALATLNDRALSSFRNETIGFIFQFFNLQDFLTAEENVMLPLLVRGTPVADARKRARTLLERVGLTDRARHTPARLSGGEQQRVAIARALANEPKLLLADEPTGNLDQTNAEHIFEFLMKIARSGVSVVIITHDPNVRDYVPRTMTLEKRTSATKPHAHEA